jgi:ribonuclease E
MTFPEAGIQVLEKAGHPLLVQEIVAKAIQEGLLSHVGQIPEQTMRERLFALARRSADRKLVVVGPGQFALIDWGLPEDPAALAALESTDEHTDEKPLRSKERHPAVTKGGSARSETARESGSAGRNKKKRRLPPLSTVVAELLGDVGASADIESLLARGREKGLMSEDLSRETLLNALGEENRRRSKGGKSAIFELNGPEVTLLSSEALEAPGFTSEEGAGERSRGAGEASTLSGTAAGTPSGQSQTLESRRQAARQVRRRVQELSNAQVERLALLLLGRSGYRDPRPIRLAGGEHERLFVVKRKLGLTEFRFLCQILPVGREVSRESLQLLREWLPEAEAHAAMVIGPGEATRDARAEAQLLGQPLLTLLCADAFLEELVLRQVGVLSYEAVVVDDLFWRNFRRSADLKAPKGEPRAEPKGEDTARGQPAGPPMDHEGPPAVEAVLAPPPESPEAGPISPAEVTLGQEPE